MRRVTLHTKSSDRLPKKRIIFGVASILICAIAALCIGKQLDTKWKAEEPKGDLSTRFTPTPTIEYKGSSYIPKTHIRTILLLGTDHYSDEEEQENSFQNGGQADFILLLVIDDAEKKITPIQIDRDTMADITVLGVLGNETGTRHAQICLAHGFGDGKERSCLLQRDAVCRLMPGVSIPYYIAMSMDGIATLNDSVGGVTVEIKDDFTALDPSMQVGSTITLKGIQAEYFVRNRMNIGIGTNEARSLRQTEYWKQLIDTVDEKLHSENDTDFIHILLNQLNPYLTTNIKQGKIINEIWNDRNYGREDIIHPQGSYRYGEDGFVEFHIDGYAFKEMMMNLFYQKVS